MSQSLSPHARRNEPHLSRCSACKQPPCGIVGWTCSATAATAAYDEADGLSGPRSGSNTVQSPRLEPLPLDRELLDRDHGGPVRRGESRLAGQDEVPLRVLQRALALCI